MVISVTPGDPHCLAADRAMARHLSSFDPLASASFVARERSVITGIIFITPISQAIRTMSSILRPFGADWASDRAGELLAVTEI